MLGGADRNGKQLPATPEPVGTRTFRLRTPTVRSFSTYQTRGGSLSCLVDDVPMHGYSDPAIIQHRSDSEAQPPGIPYQLHFRICAKKNTGIPICQENDRTGDVTLLMPFLVRTSRTASLLPYSSDRDGVATNKNSSDEQKSLFNLLGIFKDNVLSCVLLQPHTHFLS
jgi:hypothetical protein